MSTFRQTYYHITFGTFERRPVLGAERREEFLRYAWGIVNRLQGKLYRINAVEDHLHMFLNIPTNLAVAEFIKSFKISTGNWVRENGLFPGFEHWQEGYGLFTHSHSEKDWLIEYVKNQQEHHRTESFRDEFKRLLLEAGVEFEERFLP